MRTEPRQRPLVLGHRGARTRTRENTLKAFELALSEGADGIEFDVRASRDGTLVVYHDETLEVEGRERAVAELTVDELRAVRSGDGQIPTLDEVLSWQDRTKAFLNVEIKGDGPLPLELARQAAHALRDRDPGLTLISSFNPLIVQSLGETLPRLRSALLVEPSDMTAFVLPPWLHFRGINPHHSVVSREALEGLRRQGTVWIGVWTVNDPERARELAELGVDAIITDLPLLILAALAAR